MKNSGISPFVAEHFQFLSGGGEMGMLMRSKDWTATAIGSPGKWPQSLRTTLSIILNSKFPMFLFWGQELICFYNDAYRLSLGENGKHPDLLGMKGADAWGEIWHIIKPLIDQVLAGGEASWSEDQLIPIYRNGKIEDVYWTFSYSPVNDESGKPAGVFVTCSETTGKVNILKEINESKNQLQFAIDAAELGTWDLNPLTNKFTGNTRLKEWFGLQPDEEIELLLATNVIAEQDRERVKEAIEKALQFSSGGYYDVEYSIIHPHTKVERIVRAKGRAKFNNHKIAYRFNGTLQDVTSPSIAKRKTEESERRFRNIVKQAPLGITIFRGPDFMVEMANESYLSIVDRKETDFVGRRLFESLPEAREAIEPLLKDVLKTGNPYFGTEFPVYINRYGKKELSYFNFVYHPLREDNGDVTGVIVVAYDITTSVKTKHELAESEKQFRNLVMQSPIPMTIFMGKDHIIELANTNMMEKIWRKKESDVIGKKVLDIFPELRDQKYPQLLKEVYTSGKVHRENESVAYVEGDDGLKKFYLDFEYAPLYGIDGSINGILITANDVTEKVEARHRVEHAEERLRLAAEATELATWELDLKTRNIIYSPRLPEIFGHSRTHIFTHAQMRAQIHPEDIHEIVEKAFDLAMQTGMYKYEARVVKPNNEVSWINTQGKIFYGENNEPEKIIGTLRDVTEEKYHEKVLLESEQKFRLLANSIPQQVWTADTEGNLNYFNESVFSFSGLTPEQVYRDGWLQIVHPDDREENVKRWMHSITTGEDFLFEHRFCRHDGQYRWQLSRAIPHRDAEGRIQMWVGSSTDIQELKEQEQQKDFFISMASHELKTPITSIKGYIQLLQITHANSGDDILTKSLKSVDKLIERLTSLISDLLDLSKIKSGKLFLVKESFAINELVEEVTDEIKHINPGYSIIIAEQTRAAVFADRERIGQVLINLLTNAVKYSPESMEIKVKSYEEDNRVIVFVEDSGIGINKKDQEKIFERFYRVEGKNEKTFPGFGIGLFISMEIIRRHDGDMGVISEPGKGSAFYFSLPAENK